MTDDILVQTTVGQQLRNYRNYHHVRHTGVLATGTLCQVANNSFTLTTRLFNTDITVAARAPESANNGLSLYTAGRSDTKKKTVDVGAK